MEFGCIKCGLCCSTVGRVLESKDRLEEPYKSLVVEFPYKTLPNGACEKLKDGECTVYDNRPSICNVEYIRKTYFGNEDSLEYYDRVRKSCNLLLSMNNRKERI